ncbi:MAG TPA: ABC transporter ATP-binding protein [Tepidisphaeraceae bacterium]|nr:ABC transporter ATP-binding protein [Tepidisphaeraceae bacterium]
MEATTVSHAYGDHVALREVSVSLEAGEVVGLIGPNGSGKSTLIKALLGHVRAAGRIFWRGKNIQDWRLRDLARLVAYLPQSPRHEPGQTVAEILRLGRAPYWGAFGLESSADQRVTLEVARLLGLEELLDRPMGQMSGGQRQRVYIGRCLTQEPAALLLDEPNTFLDLKHQIGLWRLLCDLAKKKNLAVLLASHELNIAGANADRLILLSDGAVAASGSADAVLRPEVLSPVYGVGIQRYGDAANPVVVPQV